MTNTTLPVSLIGLRHLSEMTAYYQYRNIEPSEEVINKTLKWFETVDDTSIFLDSNTLNEKFNFDLIEFSAENRPYEHKALGIAVIALLSCTSYSDRIFHSMCEFIYSEMKSLIFAQMFSIIAKSMFPNFSDQINKSITEFVKKHE